MILVLFNLTASSIVFFLSVAISDLGVANLVGSLVMLYKYVPAPRSSHVVRIELIVEACSLLDC